MKTVITICLCCCFFHVLLAQQKTVAKQVAPYNLLANGSLEDINTCSEFDARCEPEAWFFLPVYVMEPQGNDSSRFELIAMSNIRHGRRVGNYFYTKILCPLKEGKRYRFSMWINAQRNEFEHLDVYFSVLEPMNNEVLNSIDEPAFRLLPLHRIAEKRRWKQYTYAYTATGEEQFLILGNFSNERMNVKDVVAGDKMGSLLYAIDNIQLTPLDSKESRCKEYFAVMKQLYDQDKRHPPRLATTSLDTSLYTGAHYRYAVPTGITDTFTLPDVLFETNKSELRTDQYFKLEPLIAQLHMRPVASIRIIGHTDSTGNDALNQRLSLQRANTIRQLLLKQLHMADDRISAKGVADSQPKATNETAEGRQQNRRVEILLNR